MKGFLKFVAIFAAILLLSAVLAPVIYDLAPYKYGRIFNRLVMIFSLLAVVIFVRFRKETFVSYGMDWRKESLRLFGTGFWTGFGILILFTGISLLAGNAHVAVRDYPVAVWVRKLVGCLGGAVLIGVMEEFFFRGFVFTRLRDKLFRGSVPLAMIVTSLFYSTLHFVSLRKPQISADPGFMDSLKLIAAPIQSFADWQAVWPAFVGLFIFGMVLNYALLRSKSLYPSIGLHAGCVLFIKGAGLFVGFAEKDIFFWSTKKVYDGVLGWIFLLLIWFLLSKFLKKTVLVPQTAQTLEARIP